MQFTCLVKLTDLSNLLLQSVIFECLIYFLISSLFWFYFTESYLFTLLNAILCFSVCFFCSLYTTFLFSYSHCSSFTQNKTRRRKYYYKKNINLNLKHQIHYSKCNWLQSPKPFLTEFSNQYTDCLKVRDYK